MYSRNGEIFTIRLGAKWRICVALGLADWGASTEMNAAEIANTDFKAEQTRRQAHYLQRRSENAAKEQARREGDRSPKLARFARLRRGRVQPALQYLRRHRETGASQEGIGRSLGISDRQVRRHLKPVDRVQNAYKVPYGEGWAEIEQAREEGKRPRHFIRKGEAWKLGCNLYDLDYNQRSEWMQRLKYKWRLLQIFARRRENTDNLSLLIDNFCSDWLSNWDVDTLAHAKTFNEFVGMVVAEARRNRRQNRGR
jgi:hypothetical protein